MAMGHILNIVSGIILGKCLVDEKFLMIVGFYYSCFVYLHTSTNIAK